MLKKQKQFNAESAEAEGWRPPRAEARDGTVLGGLGAENRMVSPDFRQTCQRKNRMVSPDFRIADLPPVGRTIAHKTSLSPIHSSDCQHGTSEQSEPGGRSPPGSRAVPLLDPSFAYDLGLLRWRTPSTIS